jgi:hypothetical protein
MSPRPASAARVTEEPDDFEWPPSADELSVYDVSADPWQSVQVAASDAFQARRRDSAPRAAVATRVQGITSRPPVARVSRRLGAAIAAAVLIAAAIVGWSLSRATPPPPVPVETVHHPAPAAPPPPRLKIVATYPVDAEPVDRAASPGSTPGAGATPAASGPGVVDAPGLPVAPAAVHHTLAGVALIDAPDAPGGGLPARDATTPEEGIRSLLQRLEDAYDRRDVAAAAAVWPSLDRPALTRAFDDLANQDVDFDRCDIDATAARGSAVCVGTVRYRPSIGDGGERSDRITWTFDLARSGEDWRIDRISAR